MRTDEFDYVLPRELIAQAPVPRGESRMLVLERHSGRIHHCQFRDLPSFLLPSDTMILNDTRVSARRLIGTMKSGAECEALLLRAVDDTDWEALVRPGKRLRLDARIQFQTRAGEHIEAVIAGSTPKGGRILRFAGRKVRDSLLTEGTAPLPPYVDAVLDDEELYQTVYARNQGSAAAPTAGLHFTEGMLNTIRDIGVQRASVTLHVSTDTFRPVRAENLESHEMHGEWIGVPVGTAQAVNAAQGRILAVGTTSVRALESAANGPHCLEPYEGETKLFITPGYRFQIVDALLTNFHLPKSTLLALISAFAGRDQIISAYQAAIEHRYRFFSFGDAMLII